MSVKAIGGKSDYENALKEAGGKLVVVDCFATWCGPCKMIAPYLAELAGQHTDVVFLKIDVDEQEEIAAELGVEAMPTFKFIKNGKVIDTVVGADKAKLLTMVKKHK